MTGYFHNSRWSSGSGTIYQIGPDSFYIRSIHINLYRAMEMTVVFSFMDTPNEYHELYVPLLPEELTEIYIDGELYINLDGA